MAWCIRCVRETVVRCCFYQYGVVHTCVCTLLPARHTFSHIPTILVNQHLSLLFSPPLSGKREQILSYLSLFDPTYGRNRTATFLILYFYWDTTHFYFYVCVPMRWFVYDLLLQQHIEAVVGCFVFVVRREREECMHDERRLMIREEGR